MKPHHFQYALAFIFLSLGGWCIVYPNQVERLCFLPEYRHESATSSLLIGCFGAQAVLVGVVIAISEFSPRAFLIFGVMASIPFFVFNWYFYYQKSVFKDWMLLDFIGNLGILTCGMLGYRCKLCEATKGEAPIVPLATYNVISAVRGMTGAEPHLFLLHLARKCKRKTFRLPLPIFEIVDVRWGQWLLFYLPLPKVRRVFAVSDIQLARRILQDSLSDKPLEIYTSFEGITANTPVMFTSRNSGYTKLIRNLAHHAFAQKKRQTSHDGSRIHLIIKKYVDRWLNGRLRDLAMNSKAFDPVDEALVVTFYIICEAAFNYEATYDEFRVFTDNLDFALTEFAYRQSTNPLRKVLSCLLPEVWKAKRAAKRVMVFAEKMRQAHNKASKSRNKGSESFMDLMQNKPDLLDKRQQVSEIVMFMAAGHETSGSMISNVMIQLVKHPEVQNKLRQSLLENKNGEKLKDNPYFKNVLLEANRIFPVAPMGSTRLTGRDFVLNDGTVIPANSICFLPQYLSYRDVDIFDTPEAFDPDRWKDSTDDMNDTASVAFSLGPRSCPGKPLATEEMNYLLPRLLLRYSLHQVREGDPEYRVILKHSKSLLTVKEIAARGNDTTARTQEDLECRTTSSYQQSVDLTTSTTAAVRTVHKLFYMLVALLIAGGVLLFHINATETCSLADTTHPRSWKIAILTEPSPIGSYVCGQSKRIEFLMNYLVENSNDTVELITVEVHETVRPSSWKNIPIHYTHGFGLPSYKQISISFDFTGKALRVLYRFAPDIIHVTTPGPLLFPSVIASRLFGIPLVMSCHTHLSAYAKTYLPDGLNVIAEWLLWRYIEVVHSFSDLTLVTSPQIQEEFSRNGIPNVEVWQKGVNSTQFHPDYKNADMRFRMLGGNRDDYLLVYVGRLAEEKNLVILKDVIQSISGATLCLVGAGPYENKLREHFRGTKTIFLGQLTGIDLSQSFASADIFLMPSTSETLGFVVLESMASRVPVVAANAGGLKHLIEDGRTGFLVSPDNATEFVARIQELTASPILRNRIADAARREVELLTWESSMEKLRFHLYPKSMQNFEDRLVLKAWRAVKRCLNASVATTKV